MYTGPGQDQVPLLKSSKPHSGLLIHSLEGKTKCRNKTLSTPQTNTKQQQNKTKFILRQCVPPDSQTSVGQDGLPLWNWGKMRAMLKFFDVGMFTDTNAALLHSNSASALSPKPRRIAGQCSIFTWPVRCWSVDVFTILISGFRCCKGSVNPELQSSKNAQSASKKQCAVCRNRTEKQKLPGRERGLFLCNWP